MAAVPLKRTRGVERAAMLLVLAAGLLTLVPLAMQMTVRDDARAFLDGEIGDQEFLDRLGPYQLTTLLPSIANIAAVVLVIVWMHRVVSNHQVLRRDLTWGPGWAIGGWFVPPFLYVIPLLTLREMWKASDPDVPIGADWKRGATSPLIFVWFVVYSIVGTALSIVSLAGSFGDLASPERAIADQIVGSAVVPILSAAASVGSAVVFALVATRLGDRHRRLTGEAPS